MPKMGAEDAISLALSVAIAVVAVLLALGQWWEHQTRETGLSEWERKYFFLQDLRRAVGIVLLGVLAPAIYVGSRLPVVVTELPPADPPAVAPLAGERILPAPAVHPNRRFLAIWLAVFAIIAIVLGLALIDWISTRRYAQRHRQAMSLERLDLLRETLLRAASDQEGLAEDPPHEPI